MEVFLHRGSELICGMSLILCAEVRFSIPDHESLIDINTNLNCSWYYIAG